jgi:hypothetical protein
LRSASVLDMRPASESLVGAAAVTTSAIQIFDLSKMTIEPTTVWAAYGSFVLGMFGVVIVKGEAKRARRRWREARRTWYEIEAVAVELRNEHKELPLHNAPDTVAAIRPGSSSK